MKEVIIFVIGAIFGSYIGYNVLLNRFISGEMCMNCGRKKPYDYLGDLCDKCLTDE